VVFFGMTLPVILAKDMAVRGPIKEVHEFMGNAVYFLVGLHVLGALWHQLFDRIPILQRMSLRSPLEIWRSAQRCAASMTTPSGCSDGVLLTGERFVKAIKNLTQAASMGFAEDQANPDEALEVAAEQGLNGGCFSLGITTRNHHDKSSPPPSSPSSLTVSLLSSLTLCAAFCSPLAAAAPPNTMPASVASLSDDLPSDFSDGLDATTREQVCARYVARLGDCVACHTHDKGKPMAGGLALETPFGKLYSTNIARSTDRNRSVQLRPIRSRHARRVTADGRHLYPAMPYRPTPR
jgi:hypothetical protein